MGESTDMTSRNTSLLRGSLQYPRNSWVQSFGWCFHMFPSCLSIVHPQFTFKTPGSRTQPATNPNACAAEVGRWESPHWGWDLWWAMPAWLGPSLLMGWWRAGSAGGSKSWFGEFGRITIPPPKKKNFGRMWKDWHLELFGVVFGDVGREVRELRVVDMKAWPTLLSWFSGHPPSTLNKQPLMCCFRVMISTPPQQASIQWPGCILIGHQFWWSMMRNMYLLFLSWFGEGLFGYTMALVMSPEATSRFLRSLCSSVQVTCSLQMCSNIHVKLPPEAKSLTSEKAVSKVLFGPGP